MSWTLTFKNGKKEILHTDCNDAAASLLIYFRKHRVLQWHINHPESCTVHKITRSPKHYVLVASSQTAAPLKRMASSEPNSIKEKAISKSQFYYTATCLTPLNLLRFVGTNTVSNDLQQSSAHEYSMAVLQMLPVKISFFIRPTRSARVQPPLCLSSSCSFPGGANW